VAASVKRVYQFLSAYVDSYERQLEGLSQRLQEIVSALPPCLLSVQVVAYVLRDAVVVYDEATSPIKSSMPFPTLEKTAGKVGHRDLEVAKIGASLNEFFPFLTLGHIQFAPSEQPEAFGPTNTIAWFTFQAGEQQHHLPETQIFRYLDEAGWDPKWAWLVAKLKLQDNVDYAIVRQMITAGLSSEEERKMLGSERAAALLGLERLRRAVFQLETLLGIYPDNEQRFQELFERHPYLLTLSGKVIPKPFLRAGTLAADTRTRRIPDFLIMETDGSCTLVEIEAPAKEIFTKNRDRRPTAHVTQAQNQVRQWDRIIRRTPSLIATYPGIEYYTARVVIGRSYHPDLPSYTSFQSELATVNEQLSRVRLETYDALLKEAQSAVNFLENGVAGLSFRQNKA
jgi:hypothetical protein